MRRLVEHIDYANFKDEVALTTGKARAQRYGKVWQALYDMPEDWPEPAREGFEGLPWSPKNPVGKKRAYGGVVVDTQGRFLLREVANHFDGYVWTFAKGRPEPGEPPREAALREVREETGAQARILLPLPGTFTGTTTQTHYFVMVVDARSVRLDHRCKETSGLCWTLPDEARRLIGQTTNTLGRERDLQVLEQALRHLPSPAPFRRPIARFEDWAFRPMPAARTTLDYSRTFTPGEMAQVTRGFIAQAMEQKWCAYFEDGVFRIHRSWTGFEYFRLHLMPDVQTAKKSQGVPWRVVQVEFNRHPEQCTMPERDALGVLHNLMENLLCFGEAPPVDPLAQALEALAQPNYLGSVQVVQGLVKPLLDAVLEQGSVDVDDAEASLRLQQASQRIVAAMTDDPAYTRLPWHSREQLGEELVQAMQLPVEDEPELTLAEIVALALERVIAAAMRLRPGGTGDVDDDIDESGEDAAQSTWAERLEALGQFVVAVFLGTQVLSHRGKALGDVVKDLRGQVVVR